jgi:hypothetical protein
MKKYFIIILLGFILLSCSRFPNDDIRRNKMYAPNGKYEGYSICDGCGCRFFDKDGNYEGYTKFNNCVRF